MKKLMNEVLSLTLFFGLAVGPWAAATRYVLGDEGEEWARNILCGGAALWGFAVAQAVHESGVVGRCLRRMWGGLKMWGFLLAGSFRQFNEKRTAKAA